MNKIITILFLLAAFIGEAQKVYKLSDVAKSSAQVMVLDASEQGLYEVPEDIRSCKKLKSLSLRNNDLRVLPEWLSVMHTIEELDISGNKNLNVKQTFEIISQLPALKTLKANNCNLMYLPIAIRKNEQLKSVEISNNQIPYLPPIFQMLHWEKLDVSYNCLDTLPASFVYMNTLKELDLSNCPGAYNKHNFYILEYLTSLKQLGLSGMTFLPEEISKLTFLENLVVTNGTFKNLPEGLKALSNLKELDARGCKNIQISDLIEGLSSAHRTLKILKIGHQDLGGLPYNSFKLKKLKKLYIDNSCIASLPSSFNKFKGQEIIFRNCSFSTPKKVFGNLGKARKLKGIRIERCVFGHNNWQISGSETIQKITILNCGLVKIPVDVKQLPKLKELDLRGNKISKSQVRWETPKTILGVDYKSLSYSDREIKEWKYQPVSPTVRRMIYSEVGDIFKLASGTQIEIEKEAFIGVGNKSIDGDVEIHIKEFYHTKDYALSSYPTFLPGKEVADIKYSIEIKAYQDSQQVYLKSSKPIIVKPAVKSNIALDKYYYLAYKNQWQELDQQVNVCASDKSVEVDVKCGDFEKYPVIKPNLRVSKVKLTLKRNRRKKTLNFSIDPEYGYYEQYINIFGDRIKGYPELKQYKGIKWKYVGDSLDRDLQRLYFMSESAKKEKMDKKSSHYLYVLDIKDIRVFPNPDQDNYLIQFIQGRDTFSVECLPYISVIKANKIQRWHKRKYKKYTKALEKRKLKWHTMDTTFLGEFEVFENKLEAYRQNNLKPTYVFNSTAKKDSSGQTLKIYKPGLYALSVPLLINKGEVKRPIYYLNGKRFYPRRVLVSNLSKNYHFWSGSKQVVKERGRYEISVVLKGKLYQGSWGKSNKVEFKLIEKK